MKRRANQGMAIISALGFLTVVFVLIGAAMMIGLSTSRLSNDSVSATRAQYAAEAGIEQAISAAYTNILHPLYEGKDDSWKPTVADYKGALDASEISGNLLQDEGTPIEIVGTLSDGGSYEVLISREDVSEITADKVILKIIAKGSYGTGDKAATRVISQEIVIASGRFNGDPYAVLTNNVNCIFCHTTVTSMEAAYSTTNTPLKMNSSAGRAELNTTNRIRVATLESLNVDRPVDSVVGGTVYTRGSTNITDSNKGKMLFADRPSATSQALSGNALEGFNDVDCTDPDNCKRSNSNGVVNFYKNYPESGGPDAEIPAKFPLPIPDDNNNRKIDDDEWSNAIANDPNKGYIKGGNKQFMETPSFGQRGSSLATIGSAQLNSKDSPRGIKGNLVINGDVDIVGTVYVDGDVVISGKIKTGDRAKGQSGKIVARGNIYVVGDVEYDCSPKVCDYSKPSTLPKFAMVAGGNMLVGTYMTTATGDQSWTQTYDTCGGTATKNVNEPRYQIESRTRTRTKRSNGTWNGWSGYSGWSPVGNVSNTPLSTPGTSWSPSDAATPRGGTQTETSYRVRSWTESVPKTYNKRCSYTKGTTNDAGQNYGTEYFNNSLKDSTSESPEAIDPGKYLPFIDPAKTTLTTEEQNIFMEYFGTTNPSAAQRRSYARATWVKGDDKGISANCDVDLDGCGNFRTRGSFTANEMAAFNQREYCKAQTNPSKRGACDAMGIESENNYKPRFYTMRTGAGIYRCNNSQYDAGGGRRDPSECRGYGDPTKGNDSTQKQYYVGANYTEITQAEIDSLGGVTYNLSPTNNWLSTGSDGRDSERVLKSMWATNIENNTNRGKQPLKIDGTIYSANAVFTIAPSRSQTNGSITINGSLISADMGVLAVGSSGSMWNNFQTDANSSENSGLRIHYDERLNGLIGLKGTGQEGLILTRSYYEQEKVSAYPQ
jgi:hypothetical protein